jgi:hypothetical protein
MLKSDNLYPIRVHPYMHTLFTHNLSISILKNIYILLKYIPFIHFFFDRFASLQRRTKRPRHHQVINHELSLTNLHLLP